MGSKENQGLDGGGSSIPILPSLLVLVIILTVFFGWIIPVIVLALMLLIPLGTLVYDKLTHERNCSECLMVKALLSDRYGIEADRIRTKHVKHFDTYIHIRADLGGAESLLVSISYGGENFRIVEE